MAAHQLPTKPNDPAYVPLPPRRPRPGYHRIIVDWRPIPMQAAHVPCEPGKTRCELCWLPLCNPSVRHFCRWNIARQAERDPKPLQRWAPVFLWVKDD